MTALSIIIDIVLILISIVLIVTVLMQEGQRQGLGAIGGGAETFFGKNKAKSMEGRLQKYTKIAAAVFIVLAIVATIITAHKNEAPVSIDDAIVEEAADAAEQAEAAVEEAEAAVEETAGEAAEAVEEKAEETKTEETKTEGPVVMDYAAYAAAELDDPVCIETYVQECNVKFIMGQMSLDDYDSYRETLRSMGIERCTELQQAALDRYFAR